MATLTHALVPMHQIHIIFMTCIGDGHNTTLLYAVYSVNVQSVFSNVCVCVNTVVCPQETEDTGTETNTISTTWNCERMTTSFV